jgi:hypothetical protein
MLIHPTTVVPYAILRLSRDPAEQRRNPVMRSSRPTKAGLRTTDVMGVIIETSVGVDGTIVVMRSEPLRSA